MKYILNYYLGKSAIATVLLIIMATISFTSCSDVDLTFNSENNSDTNAKTSISNADKNKLTVSFIDVGQGDSALIQCGGEAMLIDAGENDKGDTVVDYLRNHGVSKLKYAVGTHPHSDHIGGLDTVMDNIPTVSFICPETNYSTATWKSVLHSADSTGAKIIIALPKQHYKLGKAVCTIYAPQPDSVYSSANNYSVVMKIKFGNKSFLFTGDAEKISENEMLSKNYDISADVLKVGHHGSVSSTGKEFFKKVNPEYAVISCGIGNDYGHPHKETLSALKKSKVKILRTDKMGNIEMTCDGKKIEITSNNSSYVSSESKSAYKYVGNKNSYKFHTSDCSSVKTIRKSNRVYFHDRASAVKQGYKPCSSCNP